MQKETSNDIGVKVAIAGAGSIGTVLGTLLQSDDIEVSLIRRSEPFGTQKVIVQGEVDLTVEVRIVDKVPSVDILFITVQEQQTDQFCTELKKTGRLCDDTVLVSLQNGTKAVKKIVAAFPDHEVLGGTIWWSATLLDPLRVLYHRKAETVLGIPESSIATIESLNRITELLGTNFDISTTDNLLNEQRTKLILNVVSPILALKKASYPSGLENVTTRKMVHALFDEAIETAKLLDWKVNLKDNRLEGFHSILKEGITNPSNGENLHKVSTQIGIEKYGGKGSNIDELLGWLVESGSMLAYEVTLLVYATSNDYEAIEDDVIEYLLSSISYARCAWSF